MTIRQLAETIIALTGSRSRIVTRPLPVDDPKVRQPDITRARTLLGWEPKVPLDEGLRHTIEYFRRSSAGLTEPARLIESSGMGSRRTVAVFVGTRPEGIKMAPVIAALQECERPGLPRRRHRTAPRDVPAGRRAVRLRGGRRPRGHATPSDPGRADRAPHGADRRLARDGPSRHGPRAGRHHDRARGRPRLLLPEDPRRPRGGRAAQRRHLVSLSRRGEPAPGLPDRLPALRSDGVRARRPCSGKVSPRPPSRSRATRWWTPCSGRRAQQEKPAVRAEIDALPVVPAGVRTGTTSPWSSSPGTGARTSAKASGRSARPSPSSRDAIPITASSIPCTSIPKSRITSTACSAASRTCSLIAPQGYRELRGPDGARAR